MSLTKNDVPDEEHSIKENIHISSVGSGQGKKDVCVQKSVAITSDHDLTEVTELNLSIKTKIFRFKKIFLPVSNREKIVIYTIPIYEIVLNI